MSGTRWEGKGHDEVIQELERRLAGTREANNHMYVHILAASLSSPADAKALLRKAIVEFAPLPARRPRRDRRRVRRLFEQAAELLEKRP